MIYPKPLQPGDAIAIVSPASKIDTKLVDSACATLARWGFDPIVGRHCKGSCGSYSGTIDQRLSDLREAAENPKVRAVLCSRGGYGVVHLLSSLSPEFWKTDTEEKLYSSYFQTIIDNIASYKNFDTYGHIDYIVRYGPNKNQHYSYERYREILDKVLQAIIDNGLCLEVNTAGYKYGLGQPNPQADILMRYRELGGERITIGADGHKPEHIAYDFDRIENLLKACGFRYHTIFRERKPVIVPL